MSRPKGRALQQQQARKVEAKQVQQKKNTRRTTWIWAGVGAAVVAVIAVLVVTSPPPPGIEFASQGNTHLASLDEAHSPYNSAPPSSGWHFGGLAEWTEHEEAVQPELFVHNLEDAGVVLTYDCPDGCDGLLQGLRDTLAANAGKRVLITPYEGIVNPVDGKAYKGAAVAWTRVLYFNDLDADGLKELQTFISSYEGIDHHVPGIG
ncbi:MAG TPA: DUF3105 domain-containing protein [Acidimicrobiia bacterium]|jgi:hypothetical protein